MRINKREILGKKAGISYLQIFILVLSSFAFSYIIYQSSGMMKDYSKTENVIKNEGQESIINKIIKGLYSQLTKEILPSASAEILSCCPLDKQGSPCNDFVSSQCADRCSASCLQTTCSEFSDCKLGCCYDSNQGLCTPNSPKTTCLTSGGDWSDSSDCNVNKVSQCKLGCCVFGGNSAFVTEDRCKLISGSFAVDFRAGVTSEAECIALSMGQIEGACILPGGGCEMLSNQECRAMTGNNIVTGGNSVLLCTSSILNTTCKPTSNTICVEGKDEVYFQDSCGNPANIYDASQVDNQDYWENVVSKENSCGINSLTGNVNSQACGNCFHYLGSKCEDYKKAKSAKPTLGENVCANLNCENAPNLVDAFGRVISTKNRKNLESWCVYDGSIGVAEDRKLSTDVVGSRHFRYSCIEGEVKVEPCGDFRNEICVKTDTNTSLGLFSTASCRVNQWQKCLDANSGQGKSCSGVDCDAKSVVIDKFRVNLCTPKYPEGFDLSSESGGKSAESICGMSTRTCVVKYQQTMLGGCECVENCACEEATFTQQMNDLCVSLGDCGGYVNIGGQVTKEGYKVSGAPGISLEQYKKYANPVLGQFAEPGDVSKLLAQIGVGSPSGGGGSGGGGMAMAVLGLGAAGIGFAVKAMSGGLGVGGAAASGAAGTIPVVVESVEGGVAQVFVAGVSSAPSYSISAVAGSIGSTPIGGTASVPASTSIFGAGAGNVGPATIGEAAGTSVAPASGAPATAAMPELAAFGNTMLAAGIGFMIGSMLGNALGLSQIGSLIMGAGMAFVSIGIAAQLGFQVYGLAYVCFNPVSCIVTGVIIMIISLLFGGAKCKPKIVTFTCKPWQPPVGAADCGKCNSNIELKPCSKYRCQSLGAGCEFINEGTTDEMCTSSKDDGQAPLITPLQSALSYNYSYTETNEKGFKIKQKDGSCAEAFTPLSFGISTNEPAQCKYDILSKAGFDDLEQYFGDTNSWIYNHSMTLSLPSVDTIAYCLNDSNVSYQEIANAMTSLKLYTRCQDRFGHYNSAEYLIDICLKPGPDKTSPLITRTEPISPAYSSYNSSSKQVSIFTNEPADCKYSKQDKKYADMENSFQCDNDCNNAANGWECSATFTNLSKGENKFYIRCKDQPWLTGENESKRNENAQSYIYTVKSSESALRIDSISPNGTLKFGSEPIVIDLEATTSGGAENGRAVCEYKFGDNAQFISFFDTYATYHKQVFNQLTRGNYNVYVRCHDVAENTAEKTANLNLEIDSNAPIVTRVYNSGGSLYIFTNENSECAYSTSPSYASCGFIFENATQMSGGFTQEHSTEWTGLQTYYVKCRDAWGNSASGCSIKVKAYNTKE